MYTRYRLFSLSVADHTESLTPMLTALAGACAGSTAAGTSREKSRARCRMTGFAEEWMRREYASGHGVVHRRPVPLAPNAHTSRLTPRLTVVVHDRIVPLT